MKVFCIGSDGTEYYAANSEEEMRRCYVETVGEEQAKEDIDSGFEEIPEENMDVEFDFNDDGKQINTTWRKLAEGADPGAQISTGYN